MNDNEFLEHYGILGMWWGVRRSRRELARNRKRTNNLLSEVSDDDLKKITARLQLEKQYRDLTKAETSRGKKLVADVFFTSATKAATAVVTKEMVKALNGLFEKPKG